MKRPFGPFQPTSPKQLLLFWCLFNRKIAVCDFAFWEKLIKGTFWIQVTTCRRKMTSFDMWPLGIALGFYTADDKVGSSAETKHQTHPTHYLGTLSSPFSQTMSTLEKRQNDLEASNECHVTDLEGWPTLWPTRTPSSFFERERIPTYITSKMIKWPAAKKAKDGLTRSIFTWPDPVHNISGRRCSKVQLRVV